MVVIWFEKHLLLVIVMSFVFNNSVNGQSSSPTIGTKHMGMGYTSATASDEWSLYNNIGGLAKHQRASLAFAYEASPMLPSGNRAAFTACIPIKFGITSIGFFRMGDDLYNEQIITMGYSTNFGIASVGLQVNYIQYHVEGFNDVHTGSITLGGVVDIMSNVTIGAYATNINRPIISEVNNESLPTRLVLGICYKPLNNLLLAAEIDKDLDYNPIIKGGVEYVLMKRIAIRTGFNLNPSSVFLGVGYLNKHIQIGYALRYDLQFSIVHQTSVSYWIKDSKNNP